MNKQVKGLSCFRQVNADGTSFVSCSGSVDGVAVEFTLPGPKARAACTGKQVILANKANRFALPVKQGVDIFLVGYAPSEDLSPMGAIKAHVEDLDVVVVPEDGLWDAPVASAAAKKATQQISAQGADAGAVA